jgi:hypothetical protein
MAQPRSAYEIAQALWGNIAVTQAYRTLSEVLGHLDLLTGDGRARGMERDGRSLFEAAGLPAPAPPARASRRTPGSPAT